MKLLLVNIYPQDTVARYLLSGYVLKAYLNKYYTAGDLEIETLNFSEKIRPDELCDRLSDKKAGIIGYSSYIWNIETTLKVIEKIRGKDDKIVHVIGGPEVSVKRIRAIPRRLSADFYVIGEGENRLLRLVSYMLSELKNLPAELPQGVACWEGDSLKYSDDGSGNIKDLDDIPSIYLDKVLDDNLYEKQQVFLETQRGCAYKCKYCIYHKFMPSIKYYSKDRIISELDHLIVDKRITALRIIDPIFTSDLERAKDIVKHLSELKNDRGVKLPWIYWEFDYNSVDEEFLRIVASLKYRENIMNFDSLEPRDSPQLYSDMLKDYTVVNSIGIESFCEKALAAVGRRRINREKFDAFMRSVNKYNVVLKMDIIIGLPFDTLETFFEGLGSLLPYLKSTDHILNIHRLQILPGTELEELSAGYGIEYSQNAPHIVYSTCSITRSDIELGSKLSAILSRMINSPMRGLFFDAWERSGESLFMVLKRLFNDMQISGILTATQLAGSGEIYDNYWNDAIYREIPSKRVADLLRDST